MHSGESSASSSGLLNNFTQFEVQYAGIIPEIAADMDLTGRTDILRVIDEAKSEGRIPRQLTAEHNATLILDVYSLRIVAKSNQEILLCAPVHMLAAGCFVKEDDLNILGIKIGEVGGNKEISDLAVILCASVMEGEKICNRMSECFQTVFTEATTQFFDKRRVEGSLKDMDISLLTRAEDSMTMPTLVMGQSSYICGSETNTSRIFEREEPNVSLHLRNLPSTATHSESDKFSAYAAEQIQEYISMLHLALSAEDLKQFAILLKRWRSENLPFPEFFQKVVELYGSERKYLLAKMRPFIPERDVAYFESFLGQSGMDIPPAEH